MSIFRTAGSVATRRLGWPGSQLRRPSHLGWPGVTGRSVVVSDLTVAEAVSRETDTEVIEAVSRETVDEDASGDRLQTDKTAGEDESADDQQLAEDVEVGTESTTGSATSAPDAPDGSAASQSARSSEAVRDVEEVPQRAQGAEIAAASTAVLTAPADPPAPSDLTTTSDGITPRPLSSPKSALRAHGEPSSIGTSSTHTLELKSRQCRLRLRATPQASPFLPQHRRAPSSWPTRRVVLARQPRP